MKKALATPPFRTRVISTYAHREPGKRLSAADCESGDNIWLEILSAGDVRWSSINNITDCSNSTEYVGEDMQANSSFQGTLFVPLSNAWQGLGTNHCARVGRGDKLKDALQPHSSPLKSYSLPTCLQLILGCPSLWVAQT